MLFVSIVQNYFVWHYSRAFMEIFHVWFNFIWFTVHFFSIPQLMKTWLSPWKRMVEDRKKKWDFEDLAGVIIIGFLTRLIGFVVRTCIIVVGLIVLSIVVAGGLLVYVTWIALPVIILGMIVFGLTLLLG